IINFTLFYQEIDLDDNCENTNMKFVSYWMTAATLFLEIEMLHMDAPCLLTTNGITTNG
ncbi:hypothetical protein PV328_000517, partial [Microctonus aethiopoides]